jgi:starch synthase
MSKKKVLLVTQEMEPYTALSEIAQLANQLPLFLKNQQCEIRILMPRFGTINERRHRLHEVVRLSGMNIIVNDEDFPLLIKVTSLLESRIQVYFLDNDEFFKRRSVFEDDEGKPFDDNLDRAVFFCKSVMEIVKKFGWGPDIIHCHGWMTALLPVYIRVAYKTEPLFQPAKIIYSMYDTINQSFTIDEFNQKASINNLVPADFSPFHAADGKHVDIHRGAAFFADGVIKGSETYREGVLEGLDGVVRPMIDTPRDGTLGPEYLKFYNLVSASETVD